MSKLKTGFVVNAKIIFSNVKKKNSPRELVSHNLWGGTEHNVGGDNIFKIR